MDDALQHHQPLRHGRAHEGPTCASSASRWWADLPYLATHVVLPLFRWPSRETPPRPPHRSPPASPNGGWLGSQPTRRYEQGKTESRDAKQHHHTRSFEIFDVGEIALNRCRTWRGLTRVCKFTKFRLAEAQPQTCQKRRSKNAKQINKHAEAHHVLRHPTEAHHWSSSIKISFRIRICSFRVSWGNLLLGGWELTPSAGRSLNGAASPGGETTSPFLRGSPPASPHWGWLEVPPPRKHEKEKNSMFEKPFARSIYPMTAPFGPIHLEHWCIKPGPWHVINNKQIS